MENRKKTIVIGVILFLAVASALLLLLYFNKSSKKDSAGLGDNNKPVISGYLSDYIKEREAESTKSVELCRQIVDETNRDKCFYSLAARINDKSVCEIIKNPDIKSQCIEPFEYNDLFDAKNPSSCLKFKWLIDSCINTFAVNYFTNVEQCDVFGDKKQICRDLLVNKLATASSTPALCSQIKDERLENNCNEFAAVVKIDTDKDGLEDKYEMKIGLSPFEADTDKDGLTDYEEDVIYKTNPKIADTDSDGFKDGDEVKRGFNPNGTGKLP